MSLKKKKTGKIELLAPAGSLEKAQYAFEFGADAIYAGVPEVCMRAKVNNFTEQDIKRAAEFAHARKKKIYVTVNIYTHNYHLSRIESHLKFLKKIKPDAVIISDPGLIELVKKHLPKADIHLSTQANTTNWRAAKFWFKQGIKRIILAREVTLEDIRKIHEKVPKLELEYFVHGAMCMSYSGRCILSKWLSDRSANLGECTQPCRWAYRTAHDAELKTRENLSMEVKEIKSGEVVELEEDNHGTYFFNSRDLRLIEHLEDLRDAGVSSFKIEGRTKSVYYVACVTRAYRKVIDAIEAKLPAREIKKNVRWSAKELDKLANRGYTKGFLLGKEPGHNFAGNQGNDFRFVGQVINVNGKKLLIKVHNTLKPEDKIEILTSGGNISVKINGLYNERGENVESAHGGHEGLYYIDINRINIKPLSLIRKVIG